MRKSEEHIRILLPIWVLIAILHLRCDAPRNNPLDPKNPNSSFAHLEGQVQTLAIPNQAIRNVTITWESTNQVIESDGSGKFALQDIQPVDGWLRFSHKDYWADSFFVAWQKQKSVSVRMLLNAKPKLEDLVMYSIVTHQYPSRQSYQAVTKVKVSDNDGDIDSVYLRCDGLKFKKYLAYNNDSRFYEKNLTIYDLNVRSMDQTIGADFQINVRDKFARLALLGTGGIKRVIHEEVEFTTPSGYQLVPAMATLRWRSFNPGFKVTFGIEVYADEIPPQVVWETSGISGDSTSFTIDRPLPEGDYFWVIWCMDEFQNRSRSKPASFTVSSQTAALGVIGTNKQSRLRRINLY